MLIIDVVGHSTLEMPVNATEPPCMFQITKDKHNLKYQALNMHWSVLIPPSIFLGIGPLIVTTSTLEFISAQSPHSMKGLLVDIFYHTALLQISIVVKNCILCFQAVFNELFL
jgi:hypothetical protein